MRLVSQANRMLDCAVLITNLLCYQRLSDMGIAELTVSEQGKDFSVVENGDVVILPAFGASVQEMQILDEKKVQIVDTTCPWVSKVYFHFLFAISSYRFPIPQLTT